MDKGRLKKIKAHPTGGLLLLLFFGRFPEKKRSPLKTAKGILNIPYKCTAVDLVK